MEKSPFSVSDGSLAIHSMMLTAWSEGVGSNWVGFGGLKEAADFLGIPEDIDLLGIVPFGYPEKPGGRGKKNRKPLAEVAHKEKFGTPFTA
jgi:nitroreductase